jgi:hypothetical protein
MEGRVRQQDITNQTLELVLGLDRLQILGLKVGRFIAFVSIKLTRAASGKRISKK